MQSIIEANTLDDVRYLLDYGANLRGHAPDVCAGEHRVQHFALPTMLSTCKSFQLSIMGYYGQEGEGIRPLVVKRPGPSMKLLMLATNEQVHQTTQHEHHILRCAGKVDLGKVVRVLDQDMRKRKRV